MGQAWALVKVVASQAACRPKRQAALEPLSNRAWTGMRQPTLAQN